MRVTFPKRQAIGYPMRLYRPPASAEQQAEIVRQRTIPGGCEQLTLADAGLEDEVRELIRRGKSCRGES